MEALLFIFAEILFACLAPLFALAGAFFAGLLEFIAAVLGLMFGEAAWARKRKKPHPDSYETVRRKRLAPSKTVHWTAGILLGIGAIGFAASVVFFQPLLRHVVELGAEKAGMSADYERAEGSLLFGQVSLMGVSMSRSDGSGIGFELNVDKAEADVNIWTLLSSEPVITLASVKGVSGHVQLPPRDKDKPRKQPKAFRIDQIEVADVGIEIRPEGAPSYDLKIPQAEVAPFRSRSALFDLLFRSNMQAELAGQSLVVQTREITEQGRETFWSFEEVEADSLSVLVPRAPLTWLDGGKISVRVDDRWSLSDDWIDMDWNVSLDGVTVTAPANAGAAEKLLAGTLGKVVNAKQGTAELTYELSLNPDEVRALRSGDFEQFWDVVLDGFKRPGGLDISLGRPKKEMVEDVIEEADKPKLVDRLKGLFNKKNED